MDACIDGVTGAGEDKDTDEAVDALVDVAEDAGTAGAKDAVSDGLSSILFGGYVLEPAPS